MDVKWETLPLWPWTIVEQTNGLFTPNDDVVFLRGLFTEEGKKAKCGGVYCLKDKVEDAKEMLIEKVKTSWRLDKMKPLEVAKICHEINRAYCNALGDDSQVPWDEAPEWQQGSALNGVLMHSSNPDAGPEASHVSWMTEKEVEGWMWGEEKDQVARTHPCMVPFKDLPVEQQAKDFIFKAVVEQLKPWQE